MKRVLVIEDTPAIREETLVALGYEGFEAVGAENGRVGVKLAQEYAPDVIVCDIMMPELDGYGVLRALREIPSTATIPFIFLTAKTDKADLRQGMELGADDYLTKPFMAMELIAAINARLEKQSVVVRQSEKKLDALRGNLASALPAELRTPLSSIISSSELLIELGRTLEHEALLEIYRGIQGSASRLRRLIENYLLYTRIELLAADPAQIGVCRRSRCDYAQELLRECATQAARRAQREADLMLDLSPAAANIADEDLARLATELLDNAFKFSPAGTAVRVTSATAGTRFVLTVHDQGRGMTPEQISRVGAYMQFDRAVLEQQGTGLGLIISKRLAEVHGGSLTIESVPEKQTSVIVTLPA